MGVQQLTINLSDIESGSDIGFVINGVDEYDYAGRPVSAAGDVNGDGFDDVIIGADRADPNGEDSGSSYVVFGTSSTDAIELSTLEQGGGGGFVINGVNAYDLSGTSASAAGDLNGDGLDDLIIGASHADPNRDGIGSTYVVFGTTDTSAIELSDIESGSGGFVINGVDEYDYFGSSVSAGGDVNGDGLVDLIIGAYGADPNGEESGSTYVVFGTSSTDAIELSDIESGRGGFVINGVDEYDYSGSSVSAAGDVNGDGLDDLIIGAYAADPNGNYSGSSYVVFGSTDIFFFSPIELSDIESGSGGFVINGVEAGDSSGYSVSAAGDVNGDGLDDLIIGAYDASPNGEESGSTYVVFGTSSTDAIELSDIESGSGGFVINGVEAEDYSGYSVSAAGDVNDDGFDDLIIGADGADPNGEDSGSSYVVFGTTSTNAIELSTLEEEGGGGFVINGAEKWDSSGISVSAAGDVNGDNIPDLIIGDNNNTSYVIFGADTISSSTDWSLGDNINNVTLTGSNHINAIGNDNDNILTGNAGNNILLGYYGDDTMSGGLGNDLLNGGSGDDTISGGDGDDTYVVDSTSDTVTENDSEGTDTIQTSVDWSLEDYFENLTLTGTDDINATGNSADNTLTGNEGANNLDGGSGDDTLNGGLGDDILNGGEGTDTAVFSSNDNNVDLSNTNSQNTGDGTDTLSSIENVSGKGGNDIIIGNSGDNTLNGSTGNDSLNGGLGNDRLIGGKGKDTLNGGSGDDTMSGGDGNDTLNGGSGDDTMSGGDGNDTYVVDSTSDTVTENDSKGTDTIQSSIDWSLGDYFEKLTLTGTDDINATGNSEDNTLTGNEGDNILDGGSGADIMSGGKGNDTYIVDRTSDTVTENASEGTDTIQTSVDWSLGDYFENLIFTGTENLIGDGNNSANTILGNSGRNYLFGGAGDDILNGYSGRDILMGEDDDDQLFGGDKKDYLFGGEGNDTLNGEKGNDFLAGGAGNDIYIVDNYRDKVIESSSEGTDLVNSSITYVLRDNDVENLTLTGSSDINGTGNTSANTIKGNSGANILNGSDGVDKLFGNAGNDVLIGGSENDRLVGGIGNDQLTGGAGRDKFYISTGVGKDVITDYTSGEDRIKLLGGLSENDLTINQAGDNVKIKYDGDLMAIVQDTLISDLTFI